MENIEKLLSESMVQYGSTLTAEQTAKFQTYMELLLDWNEKVNLTAIKEPKEVAIKHFMDSLLLLDAVPLKQGAKVIDVGTGAGFPGIPAKLVRRDLKLTLLDSLNKRLTFLQQVCDSLELNGELVHARAEEGGRRKDLRERFDLATARAVAPMNLLCEFCLPFVKIGGCFAAMKGPGLPEELEAAQKAITLLGGKWKETKSYQLPDGSIRMIAVIEKIRTTSDIYPRHGSKIAKNPL